MLNLLLILCNLLLDIFNFAAKMLYNFKMICQHGYTLHIKYGKISVNKKRFGSPP